MFGVICITPPAASVTISYPLPPRACAKVLGPGRQIGTDLRQLRGRGTKSAVVARIPVLAELDRASRWH